MLPILHGLKRYLILVYKQQRPIGLPISETVFIENTGSDAIKFDSISGSTFYFYCSFFLDKVSWRFFYSFFIRIYGKNVINYDLSKTTFHFELLKFNKFFVWLLSDFKESSNFQ